MEDLMAMVAGQRRKRHKQREIEEVSLHHSLHYTTLPYPTFPLRTRLLFDTAVLPYPILPSP